MDRGQGLQIALIGRLADRRPLSQVHDAATQRTPGLGALGISFRGAHHREALRRTHRTLGAQYRTLVVHLEIVVVEPVFDPHPLRTLSDTGAYFVATAVGYLAVARHCLAEETQYVGRAEGGHGITHELRVDLFQGGAGAEHDVASPFAVLDAPVVTRPVRAEDVGVHRINTAGQL